MQCFFHPSQNLAHKNVFFSVHACGFLLSFFGNAPIISCGVPYTKTAKSKARYSIVLQLDIVRKSGFTFCVISVDTLPTLSEAAPRTFDA